MSIPAKDFVPSKKKRQATSTDAISHSKREPSESLLHGPQSSSSPVVASIYPMSAFSKLGSRISPSTTMESLVGWNDALDNVSSNNPKFTVLNLESDMYPADFISSLAEVLKSNKYLQELNLSGKPITDVHAKSLALALRSNHSVRKLVLVNVRLSVSGGQAMCDMLKVNRTISSLNLQNNPGIAECGSRFADLIRTNKSITDLNALECDFSVGPWKEAMRWNTTLTKLEASMSLPPTEFQLAPIATGKALTSASGSKSVGKGAHSGVGSFFNSFQTSSASGNADALDLLPLSSEPNSEVQLMVHTNRILSGLSTFLDENRGPDAFLAYLKRKHELILIDSCRNCHIAAVHRLLELGIDPNEQVVVNKLSPRKDSPLPSHSKDLNSTSHGYEVTTTALSEAALIGNLHIVRLLISYGATVTDDIVDNAISQRGRVTSFQQQTSKEGSSSSGTISKDLTKLLKDGQAGIIDLSNGTFEIFGPSSLQIRPGIKGLDLSYNNLGPVLPVALVAKLLQIGSDLTYIKLKGNQLTSIPSQIGDLPNLSILNVNDNLIDTFPASLGHLALLKQIKFKKNPMTLMPEEVLKKGTPRILQYLKEITNPVHPWNRMKLLVVGRENVGKTHLIRRLQKKEYAQNMSTDGIEISDVAIAKKVDFCIFDFGGQEVFYPTHMFFLSERSLYAVVFSLLDEESFRTVEYWLKVIRALSAGTNHTPVVLVATHADDPSSLTVIPDLKERIKKLKTSYRSVLKEVFYVSNKNGEGVRDLKAKLIDLATQHKLMTTPVPENYVLMDKILSKEKLGQRPLLLWRDYRMLSKNAHIQEESVLRSCTQFLHDVGALIWFNQPELNELIILDPQWLSDIMASVISFKANWKSGLLQHDSLPIVWKQYPSSLHKTLLGILERFEVVFPIRGGVGASIVPSMLPSEIPPTVESFINLVLPANCYRRIERTYRFGFMPIGFFSRLMARLFLYPHLLCHDPWLRGVMISSPDILEGMEDYIDSNGKIRATVNSTNPLASEFSKYLSKEVGPNAIVTAAEKLTAMQRIGTLTALERGHEQAVLNYYESVAASVLNITVWKPLHSTTLKNASDNLMMLIVDILEELLHTSYKKYDASIERILVHAAADNPFQTTEFALADTIKLLSNGIREVNCKGKTVPLEQLAPDVCFVDVYNFQDVTIEKELGEGGVGLIFLASVPTEEIEASKSMSPQLKIAAASSDSIIAANSASLSSSSSSVTNVTSSAATSLSDITVSKMDPISEEMESDHSNQTLSNSASKSNIAERYLRTSSNSAESDNPITDEPTSGLTISTIDYKKEPDLKVDLLDKESLKSVETSQSQSITFQAKNITHHATPEIRMTTSADYLALASQTASKDSSRLSADASDPTQYDTPNVSPNTDRASDKPDKATLKAAKRKKRRTTPPTTDTTQHLSEPNKDAEVSSNGSSPRSPRKESPRQKEKESHSPPAKRKSGSSGESQTSRSRRLSVSDQNNETGNKLTSSDPDISPRRAGSIELRKSPASVVSEDIIGISSSSSNTKMGPRIQVAIKRLKVSEGMEAQRFREFAHEVRLMASLDHPCIVKLHGVQLSPLGMVMEYISGKDLWNVLHNPHIAEDVFNWRVRAKIALDIARGMRYLQSQQPPIVHRDLRSPNIFVLGLDERLEVMAKVADFGLSLRVMSSFKDVLQTWQWLAPEVIDMSHCDYDESSDVYSFGIVLWEIATRKFPFSEYTAYIHKEKSSLTVDQISNPSTLSALQAEGWEIQGLSAVRETYNRQKFIDLILKENLRPTIPAKVPPAMAKLIEMCWTRDPSQRPSFHTIVAALAKMLGTDKSKRWTSRPGLLTTDSVTTSVPSSANLGPLRRAASTTVQPRSAMRGGSLVLPIGTQSAELPSSSISPRSHSSAFSAAVEGDTISDDSNPNSPRSPTESGVLAASAEVPNVPKPTIPVLARRITNRKASSNLTATLSFLQRSQIGNDHGLDSSNTIFENLVLTPDDPRSESASLDDSPRTSLSSRKSLTSSSTSIHSSNLNVNGSPPTSSMAPVILHRVLEEKLTNSGLILVQPSENQIWIGQQDGKIAIYSSTTTPKQLNVLTAHKKEIFTMAVVGTQIWVGSADSSISLWSIKKLKQKKVLKDHTAIVRCILCISKPTANNTVTISGDTDGNLIIWNNTSVHHRFVVAPNQPINSLCFIQETKHLWVGTYKKIFIYSVLDWSAVAELDAHDGMINAMVSSYEMLWSCCSNTNTLSCWDTKSLSNRLKIQGTPRITSLAMVKHPINGSQHLWAGSLEKVIYLYDCNSGELLESLKGHTDFIYALLKPYNDSSVWSIGRDCTIRTWHF